MGDDAERLHMFLSIRPRFVEAILDGTKTVELRRVRPLTGEGACAVLYASSPTRQAVGAARVARVDSGSIDDMWALAGAVAGVTRAEYDEYFGGASQASVLWLEDVRRLPQAVPLEQLRSAGIEPPQSYRYLSPAQFAAIAPSRPVREGTPLADPALDRGRVKASAWRRFTTWVRGSEPAVECGLLDAQIDA